MNEKQAKLFRYFEKWTKDKALADTMRKNWARIPHRAKGKIARWMKKVIVTLMAVKDEKSKAQAAANLQVLKGFVS